MCKECQLVKVVLHLRTSSSRQHNANKDRVFGRREQLVRAATDFLTAKQPAQPKSLDRDALMEILSKRRGKK